MNRFCLLSLSGAHKQTKMHKQTTLHKQTTVPQTKEARKIRQKKHQRTTNKISTKEEQSKTIKLWGDSWRPVIGRIDEVVAWATSG